MAQMTILDDVFYGQIKSNKKKLPSEIFFPKDQLRKSINGNQNNKQLSNFRCNSNQFKPFSNQRSKLGKLIKDQKYQQAQKLQNQRSTQMDSHLASYRQQREGSQNRQYGGTKNCSKLQQKIYRSFKLHDIDNFPDKRRNQNHHSDLIKYKNQVIQMYKAIRSKQQNYVSYGSTIIDKKNPVQKISDKSHHIKSNHLRSKSFQNLSSLHKISNPSIKRVRINPQNIKIRNNQNSNEQTTNIKLNVHLNHAELARYKQIRKLSLKLCDNLAQSQQKYSLNMKKIQTIKQNSARQLIRN